MSPARAWRPTVVARLARTLGLTKTPDRGVQRTVLAGLAVWRSMPGCISQNQDSRVRPLRPAVQDEGGHRPPSSSRNERASVQAWSAVEPSATQAPKWRLAAYERCGKYSLKALLASAFGPNSPRRAYIPEHLSPQPRQQRPGWQARHSRRRRQVRPNPSLKGSANGMPPGPVRRYCVHFRKPGPGAMPSSPP